MQRGNEVRKTALMRELGVPYCEMFDGCGAAVILGALCARELGERAIARGDEVILLGTECAAEKTALATLGVVSVCVPADGGAFELENALSPATKAVWACTDTTVDAVCTARNFCNALDLWMLATVKPQDARRCVFEGKAYHVGAVADVATGTCENTAFICTKDELPYQLMCAAIK